MGNLKFLAKIVVIFLSLGLSSSQKKKDFTCLQVDTCQCTFQNGSGINLHGLGNVTFLSLETDIIFHPCFDIISPNSNKQNHTVLRDECDSGTSLCVLHIVDLAHYEVINLAKADTFEFQTSIDGTQINLVSNYKSWKTTIHLECAGNALGNQSALRLNNVDFNNKKADLTLASPRSCITYELRSIKLGGWTVVFIVLFTLILLYFVGGIFISIFFFGVEGVEAIPHYLFWCRLWSCLKESSSYCTNCCQSSSGYDRI